MVLTNYECWASIDGADRSDITLEQTPLRSQIDLFNPRALDACGALQSRCSRQTPDAAEAEMQPKKVSQISSNGYYGFTYINNNNNAVDVSVNDVNANFANTGNKRPHLTNQKYSFDSPCDLLPRKRTFITDQSMHCSASGGKRCRLDMIPELDSFPLPAMETSDMDVDEADAPEEANLLDKPHNPNQKSPPRVPFTSDRKNTEKNCDFELKNTIPLIDLERDDTMNLKLAKVTSKLNFFEDQRNYEDNPERLHMNGSKRIKSQGNAQDIPFCMQNNKESSGNGLMFLEQMYSETHGSGVFYLQNIDSKESLIDQCQI